MNQNNNHPYDVKQGLTDLLTHQKFMTSNYNQYLNESDSSAVRSAFNKLLAEEHEIQHDIFKEMNTRGFYPLTQAEQNKVDSTKQQFEQAKKSF